MKITDEQGTSSAGGSLAEQAAGPVGPPRVSARQLRELLADDMWLDELIDRADEGGVSLTGSVFQATRKLLRDKFRTVLSTRTKLPGTA